MNIANDADPTADRMNFKFLGYLKEPAPAVDLMIACIFGHLTTLLELNIVSRFSQNLTNFLQLQRL